MMLPIQEQAGERAPPSLSSKRKNHALARIAELSGQIAGKYVGFLLLFVLFVFLSNLLAGLWIIGHGYP